MLTRQDLGFAAWIAGSSPAMTKKMGREIVIKIWGRNTSSNVQKVMWAIGEIGLPHQRIDIGGPFGQNRDPAYLAMNPNGLVPTLEEEDGFLLWESNAVVRYLAAKHKAAALEPADLRKRALAQRRRPRDLRLLLGSRPYAAGKARSCRDRGLQEQDNGGDDDHGPAAGQNRLPRRR
jgi:glutathione S-transferase